jgi:HdeA/HdeB family
MNARGVRCAMISGLLALSAPLGAAEPEHRVDVKNLNCKDFLALPDDIRPMLVAWVFGYSRAGGESNWLLDSAKARSFVSSVQDACEKAPQASFRYKVLEAAKARQAEGKKKP